LNIVDGEFEFLDGKSFFTKTEFIETFDDELIWRKPTKKEQKKYDRIKAKKNLIPRGFRRQKRYGQD